MNLNATPEMVRADLARRYELAGRAPDGPGYAGGPGTAAGSRIRGVTSTWIVRRRARAARATRTTAAWNC